MAAVLAVVARLGTLVLPPPWAHLSLAVRAWVGTPATRSMCCMTSLARHLPGTGITLTAARVPLVKLSWTGALLDAVKSLVPKGVQNVVSSVWNAVTGHHATGTSGAKRGLAVVGEQGPELMKKAGAWSAVGKDGPEFRMMAGGEQIIPNHMLKGITGYASGTVAPNPAAASVTLKADIAALKAALKAVTNMPVLQADLAAKLADERKYALQISANQGKELTAKTPLAYATAAAAVASENASLVSAQAAAATYASEIALAKTASGGKGAISASLTKDMAALAVANHLPVLQRAQAVDIARENAISGVSPAKLRIITDNINTDRARIANYQAQMTGATPARQRVLESQVVIEQDLIRTLIASESGSNNSAKMIYLRSQVALYGRQIAAGEADLANVLSHQLAGVGALTPVSAATAATESLAGKEIGRAHV